MRSLVLLSGLMAAWMTSAIGCGSASSSLAESASPTAPAGEASAGSRKVTLRDATHEDFRALLKRHEGKVVFVDYWGTWCGNCMEEFPHTVELAKKHRDQGLVVISVALELDPTDAETRAAALDFLKKENATFDNLIYPSDGTAEDALVGFGIDSALPHFQLFDRGGKLVKKFTYSDPQHPISREDIDDAVAAALTAQ